MTCDNIDYQDGEIGRHALSTYTFNENSFIRNSIRRILIDI